MNLDETLLYSTLGVSSTSSKEDVELAYRRFMMRHHPNEEETAVDPSKDPVVLANVARLVLCDPEERKKYDNSFKIFAPEAEERMSLPDCVASILSTISLGVLAIRMYGILDWNYYVVFVPVWVLDSWLIFKECLSFCMGVQFNYREISPLLTKELFERLLKRLRKEFLKRLLKISLIIAFEILVARKANDPSNTSALLVLLHTLL
ncbi:hypothetical protein BGZ80_011311 [Entomortierella chlamydospora]|uniref:J domain-containing protein n=1 Tax=Entomortierella chlamydospora TaxID=101097 RepID=A0A9P6MUA3_9FUNG|nr:hypothetical protein BGZ79_008565 [Entomortierella chlamydospora]KAG0013054.1 hypothetical protein BGZ80_011311 [Entomortierella chlamydospora]